MRAFIVILILFVLVLFIFISCKKGESNPVESGTVPTKALIAYYPFNGNANDESGNGNNGTNNGATLTSDRFGNNNCAYNFNGINNFISIPSSQSLALNSNSSSEISICAWIRTNYSPKKQGIVGRWGGTNGIRYLIFILENGSGDIHTTKVGTPFLGGTIIPTKSWHFVVGTYDSNADSLKFYYDGVLDKSIYTSSIFGTEPDSQKKIEIGRFDDAFYFDGAIDNIRIYSRGLSRQEILDLYHEGGW